MITISTREQLAEMVDKNKDLIVDDNMTIEFSTTRDEIRNVKCDNLFMLKNGEYFNPLMMAPKGHFYLFDLHPYVGFFTYKIFLHLYVLNE